MSAPDVTSQAQKGMLTLLGRHAVLFPVNMVAGILLARMLAPADFGAFATASLLIMGAGTLLDLGLGAVLVQQPEEPDDRQLQSIFTAQLGVFTLAMLIVWIAAPALAVAFKLPDAGEWLLRAMGLHLLIGSLGSISTLLLERRMRFDAFAKLDVLHVLLERGVTLGLAATGFGVWAFVAGSLLAIATRAGLLFAMAPWRVGFALDRSRLRRAVGFGLFFQGSNLVMLARDNMNALLGAPAFGPRFVGYLNWGQNLANTCSSVFVQVVGRVTFPAFSRLHDDAPARERMLTGSLMALNYASYPVLAIVVTLAHPVVTHLYGEAWRPAVPVLACFALRMVGTNVTSVLINYLNATGRVKQGFRIATAWTAVEWGLALALMPLYGFLGIAYAYAAGVALPVAWLLIALRREVPLPLGRTFVLPAFVAGLGAAAAWALTPMIGSIPTLLAALAVAWAAALAPTVLLERERIQGLLQRRRQPVEAAP